MVTVNFYTRSDYYIPIIRPHKNRNMRVSVCLFVFLLIIISCKNEENQSDFEKIPHYSSSVSLIDNIHLDSIRLDSIVSSYTGELAIWKDTIFFVDSYFGYVNKFNQKGHFIERTLGQGKGPKEINIKYIDGINFKKDGQKVFLGSSNDAYVFGPDWEFRQLLNINWHRIPDGDKIFNEKKPSGDEIGLYTFEWENLIIRSFEDHIYVPIYSQHEYFNAFRSKDYYLNGRILAEINLKNGRVNKIFGRRSPMYLQYKYLGQHSFFSYDMNSNQEFYVNHEIDPKIYVYSLSGDLIYSFGISGKDMDTSYTQFQLDGDIYNEANGNKIRDMYFENRPTKGYYTYLKCIGSNTFRSYRRGGHSSNDGLQIYEDRVLIGDIDVPKTFRVIGKIDDYIYGCVDIDEINERILLYRFQI